MISIIWMRLICILAGTSSSGSDDISTVYQPGPSFPQPQLDPRFPQPSLRYPSAPPLIPPVVPENSGFHGPFIPPQAFPQPPPAFPQPITVTTLPPRIPAFLPDRPVQLGPVPDRRTSDVGSVFIPPDLSLASGHSTGEPRPTYPMSPSPIPRPYPTDLGEVIHVPPSPSSSSGTSTDTYRRGGSRGHDSRRADSRVGDPRRGGESYESRPTSRSESRGRTHPRTSSPRRSSRPASGPLIITNPTQEVPEVVSDPRGRHSSLSQRHSVPQEEPPVHVIAPSVSPVSSRYERRPESSHYDRRDSPQFQPQPQLQLQPQLQPPQQPAPTTITILPSPSQPPIIQPSPMPMGPSFHPPMSDAGMAHEPQMPMTPITMVPSGAPMSMAPSGVPMVPGGPMPSIMHQTPPTHVIIPPSSRSSSRSSGMPMAPSGIPMAPSGYSGMPMAPTGMPMIPSMVPTGGIMPSVMQPMVQPTMVMQPSSRSSSGSRHPRTPPTQPVIINTEQPRRTPPHVVQPTQPPVVVMPDRHSPSRRTESPARRHSRHDSPPVILHQPAPYPAPMAIPQQGMLPMGPGVMGTAPMVYAGSPGSSRSHSRTPRRDAPYIVPVQQPTGRTWSRRRHDDDYDSRSPPRRPRPRHRDTSTSSYDRRRHDSSRRSPRRRRSHSRSSSYSSRSPRLHYPPATGVGPSGVVPILPTHYPTQHIGQYPSQYPSQHPSQYPDHYPSRPRRSRSSSPSPRRPPRAGATYERPYSSSRDQHTGDGSPSRYESRRPQTTSPSPWHPPPVDPTRGRQYSPSRRYRGERRTSDGSLAPVPLRRPQSSSFSPERSPRGEVVRRRPYSPSRRHRAELRSSDGSPVPVPYELRRPQSTFSPERPPRVEVIRKRPYSPPRHLRAGRYYTGAGSPGRYDPRDSFAHPYDPRGRPSERDWRRFRTPRYDRGRRYSSEYGRPKYRDPYPSSRRYHSVSSERRSPGDSRRGRDSPSGTQFPRDMSVSTGRSPTPVPRGDRSLTPVPRRESGPPVSSVIRREGPTDTTPAPTQRPLESPEHGPVIIKVPSRSEAALRRPPPDMLDEEIRAHTPAVTHVGK